MHSQYHTIATNVGRIFHSLLVHRNLSVTPLIAEQRKSTISSSGRFRPAAVGPGLDPEDMPFYHFTKPKERLGPKFESPRKRANKIFAQVNQEYVDKNKDIRPSVLQIPFKPGDAVEVTLVSQGGVKSSDLEKVRGVVLGKVNRGLGSSFYLRDVVFGEPIDRKIVLHSPLLRSIKVLEENFVFKGRRKVKRAKLYYLRERLPEETRVTKW